MLAHALHTRSDDRDAPAAADGQLDRPDLRRAVLPMAVDRSTCEDGAPLVAAIARGLAAVSSPWEGEAATPGERSYELLLATERYDAWLIHWPAGTGLDAHDHGGAIGAFAVVAGTLDEDTIAHGATRTRRVHGGELVWFDEDHVHAVVNRSDTGATSVHVYSPPLQAMNFYREDGDGRQVVVRSDDLDQART